MATKATETVSRGRGRPKRAAAPEPAPVTIQSPPVKRGRPTKDAVEVVIEAPRKRGRPAKVADEEPALMSEEAPAPRRRGRPSKAADDELAVEAPGPKKSAGRSRKEDAPVKDAHLDAAAPTLKKRGRPAKSTSSPTLNGVMGSPRVTKRASTRIKSAPTATATAAASALAVRRIDPRMRSRLRTRLPPPVPQVAQEEPVRKPTKRGRPRKDVAKVPAPKSTTAGLKALNKASKAGIEKQAKVTKTVAPRKRRGYTTIEVPDKFAAQMKEFLQNLLDGDSSDSAPVEAGEAEEQEDEIVVEEDVIVGNATGGDEYHDDGLPNGLPNGEVEQEKDETSDIEIALQAAAADDSITPDAGDGETTAQAAYTADDLVTPEDAYIENDASEEPHAPSGVGGLTVSELDEFEYLESLANGDDGSQMDVFQWANIFSPYSLG
ncbi:hypothetical protein N0V83_000076 [Neocucurbitaria cava]|uniref:Uncharacterized protein n=1 Tax=Neocucurbitaria cava TaxID=798079 RepID=A0A9W8YGU4_9PLEO|nr:hypothetical protein N0V83_000076 [Neocucurbitaria cava]